MKAAVVILALTVSLHAAEPISFGEVSLLLRMRESDADIISQVGQRRLLRALDPGQEAALQAQGASEALMRVLRDPRFVVSDAEASAAMARREQAKKAAETPSVEEPAKPNSDALTKDSFQVLQVPYGQSVNLNRWGGSSTDVKFFRRSGNVVAVAGRPTFVDPFARANVAGSVNPDPLHYYAANQILTVDTSNALVVAGMPMLYRVYDAGGVSLYVTNISNIDTVTIAVRLPKR